MKSPASSRQTWRPPGKSWVLVWTPPTWLPEPAQNRHRGSGRPLSPATPPYMRVRIRRFGGLSRNRTDHRRKPELCEVSVGQGNVQSGRFRESPGAVRTSGGLRREVFTDTPLAKLAVPSPSALPLLPHHRPESAA